MKSLQFFFKRDRSPFSTAGFTLIETVVVIAITVMLSGIFIGYTRSSNNQLALFQNQARVVGSLNRARSLALQKLNVPEACAFGVYVAGDASGLPANEFIVFQDVASGGDCRSDAYRASNGYHKYESGEEIERFVLDSDFRFSGSWGEDGESIVFVPPELTADALPVPLPVSITITGRGISGTVTVSASGQIAGQ